MNSLGVDTHTPGLAVIDPRGLAVRAVAYCRAFEDEPTQAHITRQVFDGLGRDVAHFDPRLSAAGKGPNVAFVHGLSAAELAADRVDAGWAVALLGEAGQLVQRWDSRGRQQRGYDGLLRPISICEQLDDEPIRVVERFEYGTPDGSMRNQCGQLIRHDDPATTRHMPDFDLHGLPLLETSHFLKSLEPVDWPEDSAARDALLEDVPGLDSRWTYDALGEVATQTDAQRNRRRFSLTCAGQVSAVHLQPAGAAEVNLVSQIHYNAAGLVEQERAGNGVITRAVFRPEDARLERLSAGLAGQPLLQDLHYDYDPVGNPMQIEDRSKPVTYFKNQQVDPISAYTYDSLYRLISATGREVYHAANDPNALVNYLEEYDYDAGGNSLELRHLGTQPFTRRWVVDESSNRSVVLNDGDPPPDFAQAFDGNGNQKQLLRGQTLSWDTRNQLSEVSPVTRDDGEDDSELYRYGGGGKRLRKVRRARASGRSLVTEVRYLPGLEIHCTANGEERHVIEAEAGRNRVRLEHWVASPPPGVDNDYLVYSLTDHLRSSLLELDEQGALISDEGYLPFGARAWWIPHQGAKASYKTRGYSGKHRDVTGLIYYGFRYYAPWQHRWINTDPAGEVDGLNLYCFVCNSPVRYVDGDGRSLVEGASGVGGESLSIQELLEPFETYVPAVEAEQPTAEPITLLSNFVNQYFSAPQAQVRSTSELSVSADDSRADEGALAQLVSFTLTGAMSVDLSRPSTSHSARERLTTQNSPAVALTSNSTSAQSTNDGESAARKSHTREFYDKKSPYQNSRDSHSRAHTQVKTYKCDYPACAKAYGKIGALNFHRKIHTEGKPYVCDACSQSFPRKADLKTHLRIHIGEKKHVCKVCGKAFLRSDGLRVHFSAVHMENPRIRCLECNDPELTFATPGSLANHERRYHRQAR